MEGPQGNLIQSTQEMILRFTSQVSVDAERWTEQLIDCPAELEAIERRVHQAYARGADMLVAGMMAVTIKDGKVLQAAEQTRQRFSRPLQKGRERPIAVQLLGGMIVWATTLYCAPKKKRFRKDDAPRVGLDITLAQFGFGKAVSPGLQSKVARQMALCPSIAFAHRELKRDGIELEGTSWGQSILEGAVDGGLHGELHGDRAFWKARSTCCLGSVEWISRRSTRET